MRRICQRLGREYCESLRALGVRPVIHYCRKLAKRELRRRKAEADMERGQMMKAGKVWNDTEERVRRMLVAGDPVGTLLAR